MPVSGKVLEDSIRLSKIRRIKLALYIVQTAALVGLAFLVGFVMGGARITPTLFLPIASFIAVIVLLLLIVCIESFFFRVLEIRFARSSSARHLMAKNSMKRSLLIAIITGVIAIILGVPSILGAAENGSKTQMVTSAVEPAPSFYSSDPFDLMSADKVEVSAPQTIEVYLVTEEVYIMHRGDLAELFNLRLNRAETQYEVDNSVTMNVPTGQYLKYYLVLNDLEHPGTQATITILKSVSHTFTGIVSLFMIAFVVSNVAWIAYLIPIERKYAAGSIYK